MKATRYTTSRQKACQPCSTAKAKCDRKLGRCTRCALRGLTCSYPQHVQHEASPPSTTDNGGVEMHTPFSAPIAMATSGALLPSPERESPTIAEDQSSILDPVHGAGDASLTNAASAASFSPSHTPNASTLDVTRRSPARLDPLDFSRLELFTPINVDGISNRWLNAYIPVPGQKVKDYPPSITAFVYRILKSYVSITVHGRGIPPFVHSTQVSAAAARPPLSTCLSLVRICERPLPGSENTAADVLQREMNILYDKQGDYDDVTLLAAFQAYFIYSMVLFFRLGQISGPFLRQAVMNLQGLACASSRGGLMCLADQQRARPRWESWIVAEAKRRTLFAMYLFDSVLAAQDGMQTFLGTELQGLSAPADKSLWGAQTRHEWETAYNIYLASWPDEGLHIDELWPIPTDLDEAGLTERRNRVDHWLEDVDEFGTMLYAVTSCTHGG
ncbi:hypothetical protein F5Y04DRAFT_198224 [Hypomontagnella monticulosa]|nr:hypothetical protein F5Y04DRAFT_198224 [Hypomontagnella monticulosa]